MKNLILSAIFALSAYSTIAIAQKKTTINSAVSTNNMTFIFIDSSFRTLEGETKLKVFDKV
jgi:hypothetical protein